MKPIYNYEELIAVADGKRTSKEIAELIGWPVKNVQKVARKLDLPRLPQAPRTGKHNPAFVSGRKIDIAGYVHISAPLDHPHQKRRASRRYGSILEHRLVMEQHLGRYLKRNEVIDHIDGITIHNSIENLRLFSSNAEHLRHTLTGKVPFWSWNGFDSMTARHRGARSSQVDNYNQRKKRGDVRLRQILLAWLQLDKDSPYLLGTKHWLERRGISDFSRQNLKRELHDLDHEWALSLYEWQF